MLGIEFVTEFVPGEDNYQWGFSRPWFTLYVHFWNGDVEKLDQESPVELMHNFDFVKRRSAAECHYFNVRLPANAAYLAVQYGKGPYCTRKVRIPRGP
jgi:hypothetical protein